MKVFSSEAGCFDKIKMSFFLQNVQRLLTMICRRNVDFDCVINSYGLELRLDRRPPVAVQFVNGA